VYNREIWEQARAGDLRGAADAARKAFSESSRASTSGQCGELHLVCAFCAMRQGHHAEALRELDAAELLAGAPERDEGLALRTATWRAELAYFQGRYSAADEILETLIDALELHGDAAYAAFALRIRIAILLAAGEYERIALLAERAIRLARASDDDYVHVQVLNVLGAFHFDRATSKLPEHARSHLSSLDPVEAPPIEEEAREALRYFESAREVAERAHYDFAAWYVAGNIERLEILLGRPERAVRAIRKRLKVLQSRGARYDEIVARSNLAWGLRSLGLHREALHELDVALGLVRETGAFNVLLEFLHYDRSVVLDALGDVAGARTSYRRYLRLVQSGNHGASAAPGVETTIRRPLEPYFLKRVDRLVEADRGEALSVAELARQSGVSWRTLENAFADFRGCTVVAYLRNRRLDKARRALEEDAAVVSEIATRFGFRSPTTFALEFRKRFGMPPSRVRARKES
jgi:AraC-like DNA-binding protein